MSHDLQTTKYAEPRLKNAPTNPAVAISLVCAVAICGVLSSEKDRVQIGKSVDATLQSAWRTTSRVGEFFGLISKKAEEKKKKNPPWKMEDEPRREGGMPEIITPLEDQPLKPEGEQQPENVQPRVPFKPPALVPVSKPVFI